MKIIFNDATEINVQQVNPYGDYLQVLTVGNTPEQLRVLFSDPTRTAHMVVQERGQTIAAYDGYTAFYRTEIYTGQIYGVTMYKPEKTPEAQAEVQAAAVAVAQIQAQSLTDEQALTVKAIYPIWDGNGVSYQKDFYLTYNEELYKVLQAHTSQADWTPDAAPSLFAKVLPGQDGTGIGEWVQPGSTNPYMTGDQVTHNGKTWESLIDNNVWEPGAQGSEALWQEVTEAE
ncbi:carbohydrate-binding protein [Clostridium sp. Marseille-P3244]|uniref:carbohydrate-binding protein n=1 Tax=Clostridium sp. Marseille-P3244 TaxID=1871020 RepID=UPI000AE8E4D4|nr:carbohydrate-binding protein [Clostridium sp. Marseille-P3244]